jgi:hypothetical protein
MRKESNSLGEERIPNPCTTSFVLEKKEGK